MKTVFLRQNQSPDLIVFFNGWSRDEQDVRHLATGCDVLEIHDYSSLEPDRLRLLVQPYRILRLVAWSLGVWAAAEILQGLDLQFEEALAINGTLRPVHPEFGIPPEIYNGTAANWPDPDARQHFLRRMAGSAAVADELPVPARSPENQQQELLAIRDRFLAESGPANPFGAAVAGSRDRIIPFAAQQAFWASQVPGVSFRALPLPHYPFAGLTSWKEVLDLARA